MSKTLPAKVKCFFRKWMSAKIIPHMVLNSWRIFFYRLCGYNIGKNVFIGMRCYLDDLEPHLFTVEDNCIISYGVFFACHGRKQEHTPITIKKGAYIGMRANVISGRQGVIIGENAVIGACTLVNKDIPDGATAVGVPCKILENRGGGRLTALPYILACGIRCGAYVRKGDLPHECLEVLQSRDDTHICTA